MRRATSSRPDQVTWTMGETLDALRFRVMRVAYELSGRHLGRTAKVLGLSLRGCANILDKYEIRKLGAPKRAKH